MNCRLNITTRVFYLEYVIVLYQLVYELQLLSQTPVEFWLVFTLLSLAKLYLEGLRSLFFISVLIALLQSINVLVVARHFLVLVLLAFNLRLIIKFRVYNLPKPSGQYQVGYREVPLNDSPFQLCVYYPCEGGKYRNR